MVTIILYEPQIPPNTGNIGRLCMATKSRLILVGRLGFSIDDKQVRRAGLDYWKALSVDHFDHIDQALDSVGHSNVFLVSSHGERLYTDVVYPEESCFIFGSEISGVSDVIYDRFRGDRTVVIPTTCVRTLNLSNAVAIVLYESLRQNRFNGL